MLVIAGLSIAVTFYWTNMGHFRDINGVNKFLKTDKKQKSNWVLLVLRNTPSKKLTKTLE